MKKIKFIYFFFIIFLLPQIAFSQFDTTLAIVKIDSFRVYSADSIQFDVSITRTSDTWDAWANGTIQFGLMDSSYQIDPGSIQIEYVDGSTEVAGLLTGLPGSEIPNDSYYMTPRVLNGRISITIVGPELYTNCDIFEKDVRKEIGSFFLKSNSGPIPYHTINYMRTNNPNDPYFHYQALAYKTPVEIQYKDQIWYNENDNVEMNNTRQDTKAEYVIDLDIPKMVLDTFYVSYAGQKKDTLVWITSSEPIHKGFLLTRKLVPYGENPLTDKGPFLDTIARWDSGLPKDGLLIGNFKHMSGHEYRYEFDTVPYRDEMYCYELLYQDLNDSLIQLDTACILIPNVLIYSAWAFPTQFKGKTTIRFRLEEEATVNMTVYDLEGRLVEKLIDNKVMGVGLHDEIFITSAFAHQGLYDILILAVLG